MSLPPGFIDELRARLSLSDVVGRKVMWDTRKSNAARRDFWAPCPFHQEKSASFHVDDGKGFFYCFGCHAKGDAFSFVQQTENVGFMEAVEILAREAGMPVPERDPRAQEKADERTELVAVMEQAVRHYRLQLRTGAAADARAYLARRGLSEAALERWEIGFAPDSRTGVTEALTGKGVAPALIVGAGLAAEPEGGGAPYDRFRGRIVFPIRDGRGRAIALGGRAMDPNARAKYLNSPETLLFDKGRSLYNMQAAREACGKGGTLVVAEGYMDTIALSEAGFPAVVAPLGTAITADQLALMWRMHPEPVIALDGDTAGLRAAMRLIDLALPLLEAGRSLRFALMPAGQDPDDVIRGQGAAAMRGILGAAVPLVHLLWRRETEGKVFDSPERKAALDRVLREAIKRIPDPSLRGHYGQEIKELRWELFRPQRAGTAKRQPWNDGRPVPFGQARQVTHGSKASSYAAGGEGMEDRLREAVILAALIRNPGLVDAFAAQIEAMDCRDSDHRILRDAMLQAVPAVELPADLVDALFAEPQVAIAPCVRSADVDYVRDVVAEALAQLSARRGHAREWREAQGEIAEADFERVTHRLSDGAAALDKAGRGPGRASAETEVAANGVSLRRDERDRFAKLISTGLVAKSRRHPN